MNHLSPTPVPAYILAGGSSSRFGSDKARAVLPGRNQPLLRDVADVLQLFSTRITVIADAAEKYQDIGLRTIPDSDPQLGPLGGLYTAIKDCSESDWLLLSACDWAIIRSKWVEGLLKTLPVVDSVVMYKDTRLQPLLGLYHTRLLPLVRDQIANQHYAMYGLLDRAAVKVLSLGEGESLFQVNSRDDLERFVKNKKVAASDDDPEPNGSRIRP